MLERIAQDVAPIKSARIAAAIYINGRMISVGVNQNKTDPLQSRFVRNDKCGALIHAEIAAIKAALKRVDVDDLTNATMYIARMKYNTQRENGGTMNWGLCKPCSGCARALNSFSIKRVVYTTDEGTLEEMTK